MAVYQSGKKWRADLYSKSEKILSQSGFLSKVDAQKWHDEQLAELRLKVKELPLVTYPVVPTFEISIMPRISTNNVQLALFFEDVWQRFEAVHLPTVRKGTQVRYTLDVKYRIRPFFERYKLNELNQMIIEDFKIWLMKDLSPKSVNNCLALAKTIFKKGVQWGMLTDNPAQHIPLQKLPEKKHTWWQHKEDIMKFLAAAKHDPYYLAYRLGLDCGLRLGEIIGLAKEDINLSVGQIHIHRQWLEKERVYGPTKHNKERYISISKDSELYRLMEKALTVRPESEILFFTKTGNRISGRKLSSYYFQNLIKRSGVPKIRFHDLRHTFASWYMITTDNIWDLKYLLGHQDIQTTQQYAHLSSKKRFSPDFGWSQ